MIASPQMKFDSQKLKDVVLYVCNKCSEEDLGNVKLHKILYFADMLHFLGTGKPLTGVDYQKQNYGPVARHLSWATNELAREGALKIVKRDYYGYKKIDYSVLQTNLSSRLSNYETHLLEDVIQFVCEKSAKEISELSHMAPWEAAEMGETIPYYSAFGLLPATLSDADVEDSKLEIKALRPIIEQEMHERGIQ